MTILKQILIPKKKQKMSFKQIKKTRIYEEVADQIQRAIFDGELKHGDSLPSERELCKVFGVGRQAIREALRTLSVMGLIEINSDIKGSVPKLHRGSADSCCRCYSRGSQTRTAIERRAFRNQSGDGRRIF